MAIIICPECGKEVSDQAEKCIHCGYPLKPEKKEHKSKVTIGLAVVVIALASVIVVLLLLKPRTSTVEKCSVDGCDNELYSNGYCIDHYRNPVAANNVNSAVDETIADSVTETEEETAEAESSIVSAEEPDYSKADFRKAFWGDSKESVKKQEANLEMVGEAENDIMYEGNLHGCVVTILYTFENGGLARGIYTNKDAYSAAGQYIAYYDKIKQKLIEKYGEPDSDEITNYEKQKTIDYAGAADALEYGYQSYRTEWKLDKTTIVMGMSAQNFEITFMLAYYDNNSSFSKPNTDGL